MRIWAVGFLSAMGIDVTTTAKLSRVLVVLALVVNPGCGGSISLSAPLGSGSSSVQVDPASQGYLLLLAKYPEDRQGEGPLPFGPVFEHPVTYAFVLSSEVLHYRAFATDEGRRRIEKAVRWLLDNIDLNQDGKPGWGLPWAWDAFGDGSVNPANHPYTITTAFVMLGLLDALALPNFWTSAERQELRTALRDVSLLWCREVWQETPTGGHFWYSPAPVDNILVSNVSATFLGSLSRLLTEQPTALSLSERGLVEFRVEAAARSMVAFAQFRMGVPFWLYHAQDLTSPNNLVYHTFLLWGLELYRASGIGSGLPWTTQQAVASLDLFWRDGNLYDFPQDVVYVGAQAYYQDQPAVLSGTAAVLAFYDRWADVPRTTRCFNYLVSAHGPLPDLHIYPLWYFNDTTFYPHTAVVALWSIARREFGWTVG